VSSPRERERGRLSEPQTKTEMARKIKTRRHAAREKTSEERQRGGRKSLRRRTRDKVSRRLPCPGAAPRARDRRRAGKRKTKRRNRRHELSNRGLSSLGTEVGERKGSSSKTSGKNEDPEQRWRRAVSTNQKNRQRWRKIREEDSGRRCASPRVKKIEASVRDLALAAHFGGDEANPSSQRVSGPGHEPNQKTNWNPSRTKIRVEIKALNTQEKSQI
jgi:hypothetical protein